MVIDNKSLTILWQLLETPHMNSGDFLDLSGLSWRRFQLVLDQINDYIQSQGFKPILIDEDYLVIDPSLIEAFQKNQLEHQTDVLIEEDLRPKVIYLYIFGRKEEIGNHHLQWLLQVSKNTAFSDVKRLRKECQDHQVELLYNRSRGYHLGGDELAKRSLAMRWIDEILSYPTGGILIKQVLRKLQKILVLSDQKGVAEELRKLACSLPLSRLESISAFYQFLNLRGKKDFEFTEQQTALLAQSQLELNPEILDYFKIRDEDEEAYLKALLLASVDKGPNEDSVPNLDRVVRQFLSELEQAMAIQFENRSDLIQLLKKHLVPAYYRLIFGIAIVNPLKEQIQRDFSFLMDKVSQAIGVLEQWVGTRIPVSEVGFLTMILGGSLYRSQREVRPLQAKIICPNGVSSSVLLKSQLERVFPDFEWTTASLYEPSDLDGVDLIFSTTYLDAPLPVYVTRPLLTEADKNYLRDQVEKDFGNLRSQIPSVNQILEIVMQHAEVENPLALERALATYLGKFQESKRGGDPMLKDLLTSQFIHFSDEKLTWQEAIALAVRPLEEAGRVEGRYKERIIERVEELGPYIHLGKGVAIPHARPEDGVKQLGMTYLRLAEPVYLLDQPDQAVDTFIALAAIDNQTHLGALAELTGILSEPESLNQLKEAKTVEEVQELIKED